MPYLLQLSFDPDNDPSRPGLGWTADRQDERPFVHNVAAGEVLAEWREMGPGEAAGLDRRFLSDRKESPAGEGCAVDPGNPDRLVATVSGYPLWRDGRIEVRTLLNLRGDLVSRTGHIMFVGDVMVHGDVRSGMRLQAQNVRVRGSVESAEVKASDTVLIEGGVSGSVEEPAAVRAGRNLRVAFCEHSLLMAGADLHIDANSVGCELYAGRYLSVKDRLQGKAYARDTIYVRGTLGSRFGGGTSVILGYDPLLLHQAKVLEEFILSVRARLKEYGLEESLGGERARAVMPELERARRKLEAAVHKKRELWERTSASAVHLHSRLIVPGEIRAGVEVTIGPAYLQIEEDLRNVTLTYRNHEIIVTTPAVNLS